MLASRIIISCGMMIVLDEMTNEGPSKSILGNSMLLTVVCGMIRQSEGVTAGISRARLGLGDSQ